MKKTRLTFLFSLALLSCGGSSSSEAPTSYFAAFEEAAKAGLQGSRIGMVCNTGNVKAAIGGEEGDTHLSIKPFVFDFRFDGIHATAIDDVKASLLGHTSKYENSKVYIDGPNVPSSVNGILDGVPLCANFFLENSRLYIDLADCGLIRSAISNLLVEKYPDYEGIYSRSHKDLTGLEEVEEYLPIDSRIDSFFDGVREAMEEGYRRSPGGFHFLHEGESYAITFEATSWATIRSLFNEADLSISSLDASSLFDEAERRASIDRCRIDVKFASSGVNSIALDLACTFAEDSSSVNGPKGTWELGGQIDFLYGEDAKPETVSSRVKTQCENHEFVLPDFSQTDEPLAE